jgi:RNA polymerase sigma-70 factor (ECF subfamily)
LQLHSFDDEYVRRLIAGDPAVGDHFTAYFSELLLIKLRARLPTRQLVEDARQETFVRVLSILRAKGGLEQPERLGAFVHTVCSNVLFEMYRAQGRASQYPEHMQEPPDQRFDAESELITAERKEHVKQVLQELPPRDREVLRMLFWEGVDRETVCSRMKVDADYLRVVVHRAKNRLRDKLHDAMKRARGAARTP